MTIPTTVTGATRTSLLQFIAMWMITFDSAPTLDQIQDIWVAQRGTFGERANQYKNTAASCTLARYRSAGFVDYPNAHAERLVFTKKGVDYLKKVGTLMEHPPAELADANMLGSHARRLSKIRKHFTSKACRSTGGPVARRRPVYKLIEELIPPRKTLTLTRKGKEPVTLTGSQLEDLRATFAYQEKYSTGLSLRKLAVARNTTVNGNVAGTRMRKLKRQGMVWYPEGDPNDNIITDLGTEFLEKHGYGPGWWVQSLYEIWAATGHPLYPDNDEKESVAEPEDSVAGPQKMSDPVPADARLVPVTVKADSCATVDQRVLNGSSDSILEHLTELKELARELDTDKRYEMLGRLDEIIHWVEA
jgi:hypothetical protein